jgi:hypothetical protein
METVTAVIAWLQANWAYVVIGVMAVDKAVAVSPMKQDDLLWTAAKGIARQIGSVLKATGAAKCVLALVALSALAACAAVADRDGYSPPAACVCRDDGTRCAYDSVILRVVPDPRGIALVLKLTNLGAVRADAYTASEALAVVEEVRALVSVSGSWSSFVAAASARVSGSAVAAVVLTSEYLKAFDVPEPLSDCDRAILVKHLDEQAALLTGLKAGGE